MELEDWKRMGLVVMWAAVAACTVGFLAAVLQGRWRAAILNAVLLGANLLIARPILSPKRSST